MTEQPTALRLADDLVKYLGGNTATQAAAELRRLHAENERLHQINQSHEMKLSVRGYEIQIADLEAQRDALLEALKGLMQQYKDQPECFMDWSNARAAIKQAEENT